MIKTDILIIGSGPSGVSATFPLVEAGLKVLLIDGGRKPDFKIPKGNYLENRMNDENQWKYFLGSSYESVLSDTTDNPKLRVPRNSFVSSDFLEELSIRENNFQAIGSLASGGLSNIWGATVASFQPSDFKGSSMEGVDLTSHYKKIAHRIGVSGDSEDQLSDFVGNEYSFQESQSLDPVFNNFISKYNKNPKRAEANGIKFGKSRNAILTSKVEDREGCEKCGMCMYGCTRGSIYNSSYDLRKLKTFPNFKYMPGYIAKSITRTNNLNQVKAKEVKSNSETLIEAKLIILASGPFSTIRIILESLKLYDKTIQFFSNPITLFALLFPSLLGSRIEKNTYNFGQLAFSLESSYRLKSKEDIKLESFGVMYDVSGIPIWELLQKVPLTKKNARRTLRYLLPAMRAGNCYLPGQFSNHKLSLSKEGVLNIEGSSPGENEEIMKFLSKKLKRTFRRYGGFVLPGSFSQSIPGSDAHSGGTSSHSLNPKKYETKLNGEVEGLEGVFVVDASVLPTIPTKPYTFTIMANADRIARGILSTQNKI